MTRRALHASQVKEEKVENTEKRELRSSPDRKHIDRKTEKCDTVSQVRTRRGSEREGENLRRRALRKFRKSSDSSGESDHSQPDTVLSEPVKPVSVKSDKTERPPPLLIPCNLLSARQNGTEKGPDKGTSGSTDSIGESGREEILENILTWQMLTPEALEQLPTPPALLYGAHHLLRMFGKMISNSLLTLSQTSPGFYVAAVQVFRKHGGKRRNCLTEQSLLFPQCFLFIWMDLLPFSSNLKLSSATLSVWKSLKFVVWERVNSFPKDKFKTIPNSKSLQTTI